MLKTILTAAALATAGLAASPANAGSINFSLSLQGPYGGLYLNDGGARHTLSEGQVKHQLRYQGWQDVDIVGRDATTYHVTATWYGQPYTLTVSAFDATVLAYYPVYPVPAYPTYPLYPVYPNMSLGFFGGFGPNY